MQFNLETYIPVNERIVNFWKKYENGRIITSLEHIDPPGEKFRMVVFKAEVYVDQDSTRPISVGWAKEREGTMGANKTAFLENAETSAIGRALANMGVLTERGRASREEMASVERVNEEHALVLEAIKSITKAGNKKLQEDVKKRWVELKSSPVEAAKFLEELGGEFPISEDTLPED